ncbi:D-amino-acid oxidase [Coprinopsis sp. MPI-PUGE-AT-0042]|nr:D-amino-acid oxidase [Coprinopsis sp. MPI-PUGE-AT-0042]
MSKSIVVLGAGVIGLTTALKLQEAGYRITIIAEIFPTDPQSAKYTSHWAGANHVSFSSPEDPQHALDCETFTEMWKLSEENEAEGCFLRLQQTELLKYVRPGPSSHQHKPEFRVLSEEELVHGAVAGETFKTVTIDVPNYLNYLLSKFLSRGGKLVRGSVQHLSQIAENGVAPFLEPAERRYHCSQNPSSSPDAIVVCVGLGARHLGGVEDQDVYPIRGQTVLIHAPWIRSGGTLSEVNMWTYVIPRRSGNVILGGTMGHDDWYPQARPETTRDILERALKFRPDLVPEHLRKDGEKPSVEDIMPLVIEEGCGFRPGRKGGLRLEAGQIKVSAVIYNYGHAGAGYVASFGTARVVVDLVEAALKD